MPATTIIPHPLVRDGKSQNERLDLGSLVPETLAIDDRSEQQLLAYLYEYAKSVAYYDVDGGINNWQDFFRSGVAIQTAIISQYQPDSWQQQFKNVVRDFDDGLSRSNLSPLLDFLFETAIRIDGWQQALANDTAQVNGKLVVNENDLRRIIRNLITSNLNKALEQLVAIANVWADRPTSSQRRNYDLPDLNSLDIELWPVRGALGARDVSLRKLLTHSSDFEQAVNLKLHEIFQVFLQAIRSITDSAKTLNATPATETHDPQLGLLYAFTRLFQQVRDSLNGMSRKHLDFYYRDVLALKTRPHIPDTAHVVFELNKPSDPQQLIAGTALKNGKDANGAEIRFGLEEEVIVSKAQIQSLRTLYNEMDRYPATQGTNKIYAAPVANSADGQGAAFDDPSKATWATLGEPLPQLPARVGLMIASPALRLAEGTRTIEITLTDIVSGGGTPWNWGKFTLEYYHVTQETISFLVPPSQVTTLKPDKVYGLTLSEVKTKISSEDSIVDASLLTLSDLTKKINRYSFKPSADTFKLLNKIEAKKIVDKIYVGTSETVETKIFNDLGRTPFPGLMETLEKAPPFLIEFSGKKGWFKPQADPVFYDNKITIRLGPKDEAILDADPEVLKANFNVTEPIVRLTLNPDIFSDVTPEQSLYEFFNPILLDKVDLKITVSGLQDVTVTTDDGPADPTKIFLPFGAVPVPGKQFSVDHPAFYGTDFESCSLVVEWDQLPQLGFHQHYELYEESNGTPVNITESFFTAKLQFGQVIPIPSLQIFNTFNSPLPDEQVRFTHQRSGATFSLNDSIRFTLETEFFHRLFPESLARRMLKLDPNALQNLQTSLSQGGATLATAQGGIAALLSDPVKLPPTPYTPIIKSISLEYVVTATGSDVTLFHLHPFEESNYQKINPHDSLLPQFDFEGALLIGLNQVKPGSTLDLLFQFNEFTADAYLNQADPEWYYLSDNSWKPLAKGKNVVHDDTEHFIRSGIVHLMLPFDLDLKPTFLPPDLCWLKVSVQPNNKAGGTAAVCRAIAVHSQAAKVIFQADKTNDLTRLNKPLPAGSISKMVEPDADIKGVQQPYGSFGGRPEEKDPAFYARASEQLRHKGRAVSLFDYEQLVLEAFPDIYKVKCITHTLAPRTGGVAQTAFLDRQAAPGYVTLVVVPSLAHLPVADRLEPRASRSQLEDIAKFLQPRMSPFVRLRVMNPGFDRINTKCTVIFHPGKSGDFYREQLTKELEQYLSPWAFDPEAKIPFGGTVFQSAILGFIEGRQYVDYVQAFTMWKNSEPPPPSGELTTSTARAILVSGKHQIL